MLDLDEMKQRWTEHDRKLDESIRLNRQLLGAATLNRARTALRNMTALLACGAIVWGALVISLGSFIYGHLEMLRLSWCAAALDLYAIGMLAATIRQIVAASQIDYGGPLAAIQQQLESLRVLRIRITQSALLAGTIVWAPFAVVFCKAFLGLDIDNPAWLWANVAFGLSLIPLTLGLSKTFGHRMDRSPFLQRLMNDIAGSNLKAAAAFLAKLTEFERDPRS